MASAASRTATAASWRSGAITRISPAAWPCNLEALGFGTLWDPGFHVLLKAEHGRTYRLQSSSQLPADSWTDVDDIELQAGYPDPVRLTDPTASRTGQRFYRVVSP